MNDQLINGKQSYTHQWHSNKQLLTQTHTRKDKQIKINIKNNNKEDSSFLISAEFRTLDDGHFRPKHVLKCILNN
jgi:hypothetical protein